MADVLFCAQNSVEGLAGIRPGSNGGYKQFLVVPGVWATCPLEWAKCRFDSPYGPIESNWRRDGDRMLYDVLVPPNTKATVSLRKEPKGSFTESGKSLSRVKGIRRLGQEGSRVLFELQPGQYLFEAR